MSVSPNPQDWMVLQCRSCGSRMKSRRETALTSRLLCPKCRTPVPVQLDEDEPERGGEEFRPEPLPAKSRARLGEEPAGESGERRPVSLPVPSTEEHPEFSGASAFSSSSVMASQVSEVPEATEESGDAAPEAPEGHGVVRRLRKRVKKRTKRKKIPRVKYEELADWNSSDLEGIPEAEIGADIWAEAVPLPEELDAPVDEQVYLVEELDSEGNKVIRRRKTRRSRLLRGARLFFRRLLVGSRYFATGLAVLVAISAVYGLYVLRQQFKEPEPVPVSQRGTVDPSLLTKANEEMALAVVRAFLSADGVAEKLKHVRHPSRVRPMMEAFYRRPENAVAAGPLEAGEVLARRKEKIGDAYYVMLAMPVLYPDPEFPGGALHRTSYFIVEEIYRPDRIEPVYLLDWETSSGYQSMPLEEFKMTRPREPKIFRLKMRPSDYYNHGFTEEDWQSVELYYPSPEQEFRLYGYIRRASQEGRELQAQMADERQPALILELAYPEDAVSSEQVVVRRMVHPSWYYATEEEGFRAERSVQ